MQYSELADLYAKLEKAARHLEKTFLLAKFLERAPAAVLKEVLYLLQGRVFPHTDDRKIGVSTKLVVKALSLSSGVSAEKVDTLWREYGDLGDVAQNLLGKNKQQTLLSRKVSVEMVIGNIRKLAELEGEGTVQKKIALISELLTSASTLEAKYIVRTILESLRTGVADGLIRDAIAWAFLPKDSGYFAKCKQCHEFTPKGEKCIACGEKLGDKEKASLADYEQALGKVQGAYDLTNDFGEVAEILKKSGLPGLEEISIHVGKPLKVMLYQKAENIENGFEIVGKPAAVERKLDGFRVQIHKSKDEVKLFTRRLEDVTRQFPDVVSAVKKAVKSNQCILDAEIVGIDAKGKFVPFQFISQRIKRKYEIEKNAKDIPVIVQVFDILFANGESLLHLPYRERRARLAALVRKTKEAAVIEQRIVEHEKDVQKFYKMALSEGCEGVMMKSLDAAYQPGRRVGYGVKIKPTMENLDLAIIGAEWGEGKRTNWLSSFTLACRDGNQFLTIGKVSTGLKEKSEGASFEDVTNLVKPHIIEEKGREVKVKPKVVVEVAYEEIQKSPT
ncbi:ATP-dependent DNA ligase, partial [Candidatus Woesearchaeota archaeon]|nr:ATP-dependent DNA ligase [Candidatus Woesearchaeota archaeon]